MRKVNVSTENIGKFSGKWVAILGDRVIAVGDTLKEISPFVTREAKSKTPDEKIASAFKVPYKGEGPYVL